MDGQRNYTHHPQEYFAPRMGKQQTEIGPPQPRKCYGPASFGPTLPVAPGATSKISPATRHTREAEGPGYRCGGIAGTPDQGCQGSS